MRNKRWRNIFVVVFLALTFYSVTLPFPPSPSLSFPSFPPFPSFPRGSQDLQLLLLPQPQRVPRRHRLQGVRPSDHDSSLFGYLIFTVFFLKESPCSTALARKSSSALALFLPTMHSHELNSHELNSRSSSCAGARIAGVPGPPRARVPLQPRRQRHAGRQGRPPADDGPAHGKGLDTPTLFYCASKTYPIDDSRYGPHNPISHTREWLQP
jgi:hypothetical protein